MKNLFPCTLVGSTNFRYIIEPTTVPGYVPIGILGCSANGSRYIGDFKLHERPSPDIGKVVAEIYVPYNNSSTCGIYTLFVKTDYFDPNEFYIDFAKYGWIF